MPCRQSKFPSRRTCRRQPRLPSQIMIRIAGAPFALLVFVVVSTFAKSPAPEVIFISPCECEGFHGKNRWIVKTDFTPVPLDESAIQSVTPSQVYAWEGLAPDVDLASMGVSFPRSG